ncbi:hypothetical protein L228DRAFT_235598 [Xylona heveae TC161]|uniref:SCD domain-containing protein n=1 Tax=Xylona heveae (strain CBS 132557 / TC161) TaxID=1328760 RepID=A0A165JRG6_XYLHT|nr:hypothetical protein L228DRAFT_235598 [Xylona heveae TC161]KZF26543.1 hypothetical protein L228DRAFT_235598 [Xylona heveae TC161]
MELSDPATPESSTPEASLRRRSGRVVKQPQRLSASQAAKQAGRAKRKRTEREGGDEIEEDGTEPSEDESDESDEVESEPDEEELKERRRAKARSKKAAAAAKPAAKKPKTTNGVGPSLAMRPAPKGIRKPRKPRARALAINDDEAEGLYAEVFARGHTVDAVTAEWLSQYEQHNSNAVRDLVNFVLKCSGCNLQVDEHDIEDPDNVASRLDDLQEEYQSQSITEYPLISKAKGHSSFRSMLTDFFGTLIATLHASSTLYTDATLMENIQVWIGSMSSSAIRPFRHTATVVSLSIVSALCEIARGIVENTAKTLRQQEGEKKKGRVNKGRVTALQEKMDESGKKRDVLEGLIKDIFDTVFVHRYRDVDPRIRTDCVQALGYWILIFPDLFFEGQYLRYLGWLLSDIAAPTRAEVVKQLQKIFRVKDNIAGLRTFTDRFRPRLVEMATRDADAGVRASAVELLDTIREAGMLEPDDIDTIGRLIFDSEGRVRKAVVNFFSENINDLCDSRIDDLGGKETLEEALAHDDEDYESPQIPWVKLKCLAEVLKLYDSDNDGNERSRRHNGAVDILVAGATESRFSLAAHALCEKMPELQKWEILAGYVLFDHSASAEATGDDPDVTFKKECALDEGEEVILLEVLHEAVKHCLTQALEPTIKGGKAAPLSAKARQQQTKEIQETAALHLAQLIPRLLKKFGPAPDAASAVLRLEHLLNLEVFQELRQDSTTYSALLDDINRQFLSHADPNVLVEASAALLHAKSYEELEEVTEGKVQLLWEDTVGTLHNLAKGGNLGVRGNFTTSSLKELCNNVRRISNLASISDCVEPLETVPALSTNERNSSKRSSASRTPTDASKILLNILSRGKESTDTLSASSAQKKAELETEQVLEDSLVESALKSLMFYFMWKTRSFQAAASSGKDISSADIDTLQDRRAAFARGLLSILRRKSAPGSSRLGGGVSGIDDLRLAAAGTLLDLYTLFAATFRQLVESSRTHPRTRNDEQNHNLPEEEEEEDEGENQYISSLAALIQEIPSDTQKILTSLFTSTERVYSQKANRTREVGDEDDPIDSEDDDDADLEDDDDEDEDDDEVDADATEEEVQARRAQRKLVVALSAEQKLCELTGKLVLAILAKVLDHHDDHGSKLRTRILRNRNRLGQNFKEVVAYLDESAATTRRTAGAGAGAGGASAAGPPSKAAKASSASASAANKRRPSASTSAGAKAGHGHKSKEYVLDDDDDEDDDEVDDNEAEEEEEDDAVHDEHDEDEEGDTAAAAAAAAAKDDDGDDILGD